METQAPTSENRASSAVQGKYRVTNWPEYDHALVQRGRLTVWFDEEFVRNHGRPERTGQRGAPLKYSDMAIQVLLMLKVTFRLTYRALAGVSRSLRQRRSLEFDVPDPTHMARRAKGLTVPIPRKNRTESRHLGVDNRAKDIRRRGMESQKARGKQAAAWDQVAFGGRGRPEGCGGGRGHHGGVA